MQHLGQLLGLLHRRLDLVEPEVVGDLLGVVDDVVERGGQLVDVLAVDRGDERLVEALDDVVRDPVAVLLADQDVARELVALGEVAQHLLEQAGGAQDVAAGLLEQVEELAVARGEDAGEAHRRPCTGSINGQASKRACSMRLRGQLARPARAPRCAAACQSYATRRSSTRPSSCTSA